MARLTHPSLAAAFARCTAENTERSVSTCSSVNGGAAFTLLRASLRTCARKSSSPGLAAPGVQGELIPRSFMMSAALSTAVQRSLQRRHFSTESPPYDRSSCQAWSIRGVLYGRLWNGLWRVGWRYLVAYSCGFSSRAILPLNCRCGQLATVTNVRGVRVRSFDFVDRAGQRTDARTTNSGRQSTAAMCGIPVDDRGQHAASYIVEPTLHIVVARGQ